MSKPVKALLRKELIRRLEGVDSLAVVSLEGVDGQANNRLRGELRGKDVRVTVVKNSIARQALKEVGLEAVCGLMAGPCALAVGGDSVVELVRDLLAVAKEIPAVRLRGALMEGEAFGPERMVELSRYPTREEAVANVAMLARSPGSRLCGAVLGPGGRIAGILKTIEERAEAVPEPQEV